MIETLISLTAIGFLAGFFFSMPVAGPVSILVVSFTLHNHRRRAMFTAIGAAVVDFLYIFIAVFGFTKIIIRFNYSIPYILILGSLFIFYIGYKLWKTQVHFDADEEKVVLKGRLFAMAKGHHSFLTGFLVNLLNPTLFMGWLISSFVILSFAASHGINVGGMEKIFYKNVEEMNHASSPLLSSDEEKDIIKKYKATPEQAKPSLFFQILNSLAYALSVAIGSVVWFYLLSGFLCRHKEKISIKFFNHLIHGLAVLMIFLGFLLVIEAVKMLHLFG
jgi:threonine/homoserine/homoserine lactone efflux protein